MQKNRFGSVMSQVNKIWILVGIFLMIGVFVTVWDYRQYRKVETQNYGQGPGDKLVSWNVNKLVQTQDYRLKYPEDLQGVGVNVDVRYDAVGTLKDWEDKEIATLAKNEQMYGERNSENTERTNMTLIRFQRFEGDNTFMVSRYLAKKNDKLFIVEFVVKLEDWQTMEGNVREMARSFVLL